ncbi:MAG: asparaginase [Gammaproteobacteria bacterium]|nr:asparaginase [Gammaproteobacteria bacterium]
MSAFVPVAELIRGGNLESVHHGVAVAVGPSGDVVYELGDASFATYPRSALKPIQALHLIESGAFAARGLTSEHVAIACASHMGEPFHAQLVSGWLDQLALGPEHLACGPTYPLDPSSAHAAIRAFEPSSVWHNCSGKHTGFLCVAQHMGWSVHGYEEFEHPAQIHYREVLAEFFPEPAALQWGRDDCTLPAPAMTMGQMAHAMSQFAQGASSRPARADAIVSVHDAMRAFPLLVDGTGGLTPDLVAATGGDVIVKVGAEGYLAGFVPRLGLGFALKVADGNGRARRVFTVRVLEQIGALRGLHADALRKLRAHPVHDSRGERVGELRAV